MFLFLVVCISDWAEAVRVTPQNKENKTKVERTIDIFSDKSLSGVRAMN